MNKVIFQFTGIKNMNLNDLAVKYKTDKWGKHFYTPHYEKHFAFFKDKPVNILEIGIGGYADPQKGGNSLRVWSEWFTHPETNIIGIDISDKLMPFNDPRVKVHKGSQVDRDFLVKIHRLYGDFDIVIDDGSHRPEHVIETFEILYPKTKDGGVYVVEDTQTSYWDEGTWGARATHNQDNPTYAFFRNIPDWINYAEIPTTKKPDFYEMHTVGVHFYHNLIFIDKNTNTEQSNIIPSRLDNINLKTPIIFDDNHAGNIGLMAHIGRMGDVTNRKFPSLMTDGKHHNYIQGFMLTCDDIAVKRSLEYKARLSNGEWTDWVACNVFTGTRGESLSLTGISVRLNEELKSKFHLKVIGAFDHDCGLVIVGNDEICVSNSENSPLYGMQVILKPANIDLQREVA